MSSLGKNNKGRSSQKVGLKKWNLEGRRKTKGQSSRTLPEQGGQLGSFEKGTSKEGNNEE